MSIFVLLLCSAFFQVQKKNTNDLLITLYSMYMYIVFLTRYYGTWRPKVEKLINTHGCTTLSPKKVNPPF